MSPGEVEFRRPWGGTGGLVRLKVFVDEVEVLRLQPGESARLAVEPGEHTIQARLANRASLPLTIQVEDDGEVLAIEIALPGSWDTLRPGSYKGRKESLKCTLVDLPAPPS